MTRPPDHFIRTRADELALDQGAVWDQRLADQIIRTTESLLRPQYITGRFRWLDWQAFILRSLYGWRWPDGRRRFRFANVHVPKKAGKTLLVSALCLHELFCSGEPSPYVAAAAASIENAGQVFEELRHSVEAGPLRNHVRITRNQKRIRVPGINAQFRCFASQGSRVHGEPCSAVVLDECAVHSDPELYRALRWNTDARPNGIVVCISTAGSNVNHWYYDVYQKSKRVLSGEDTDVNHFAVVYEMDPQGDPADEAQWLKANPSIGTSFPLDQFRRDFLAAQGTVGESLTFRRLKLNQWVRPEEAAWLDVSDWSDHRIDAQADGFEAMLRSCRAAVGVDLSLCLDPSSVAIVWQLPDGQLFVRSWAWVCDAGRKFRDKGTLPKFDQYIEAGSMTETPGDMIDREPILAHILELCQTYQVEEVRFDPTSAAVMMNEVAGYGYEVRQFPQSFRHYNTPMNEFYRAYRDGKVHHDGNADWLKYCLSNVRVETGKYGEIRPFKRRSLDHIDGAISTLLAFSKLIDVDTGSVGVDWL